MPISRYRSRSAAAALAGSLSLAAVLLSSGCGSGDRPNLVLITVDSLRRDVLEDYGAKTRIPFAVMPNTDRMMDDSTVLMSCYTVSPRTTQSIASLMTGLYPTNNGAFGVFHTLPDTVRTLAEVLKKEGYRTYAVVTSYFLQAGRGFEQGFDIYDDGLFHSHAEFAELVVDRAERLSAEEIREPYFLWLHISDPAWPYDPPKQTLDAIYDATKEVYTRPFTLYEDIDSSRVARGDVIFRNDLDAELRRHMQRRYLGEVSYADGHIGRLAGILDSRGLMDNTLLVFCADHGESMGEHDYYYASGEKLYQPSVEIPAFFKQPGVLERRLVPSVASIVDFTPTILELLGVEDPESATRDGTSLAGVLEGAESSPRDVAFIESDYQLIHKENPRFHGEGTVGKWRAVVTRRYKLIRVPTGDGGEEWELYDLQNDPGETTNIADERPATVEELRVAMSDWDAIVSRQETMRSSVQEETTRQLRSLGYVQ